MMRHWLLLLLLLIISLSINNRRRVSNRAGTILRESRSRSSSGRNRSLQILRIATIVGWRSIKRSEMCWRLVNVRLRRALVHMRRRRRRQRLVHGHSGGGSGVTKAHVGHGLGELVRAKVGLRHLVVSGRDVRDGVRARYAVLVMLMLWLWL